MLVTDYAPSSILRAKHVRRWALTFGRFIRNSFILFKMADQSRGFSFYRIIGMPVLSPRSKFGTPFGLRGVDSRGCVRRPKQNRSGSRGIGIRIREIMIQVFEFGNKAPLNESRKTSNGWNRTRKLIIFSFLKSKQTKAHESLWNQNQNYGAEPSATANERACHGSCSEQHAPRQARSSLSLNVRQNLWIRQLSSLFPWLRIRWWFYTLLN